MARDFDPRAWNLLTGVALVTGCGGRQASIDDIVDDVTTVDPTGDESSCANDSDCPSGYYCDAGQCQYVPYDDGHHEGYETSWPYYECYDDVECGILSVCNFNNCEGVSSLPDCGVIGPQPPPLDIPDEPLRLTFADIDADGSDELIVVTPSELLAYEAGDVGPSAAFPHALPLIVVDDMVGDAFDPVAGEDVMLLANHELHLFSSDGVGLMPASAQAEPFADSRGLVSGEFDNLAPADVLVWGSQISGLLLGSGELQVLLSAVSISSASARGASAIYPGYVLREDNRLWFLDTSGLEFESLLLRGNVPAAETTFRGLNQEAAVGVSDLGNWSLLELWDPGTLNSMGSLGVPMTVTSLDHGDLDGDNTDELVLSSNGELSLLLWDNCHMQLGIPDAAEVALGDHDGDGDDELAVRTSSGLVWITDIE